MKILTPKQSEQILESDIETARARHKKRLAKFAKTEAEFEPRGISPAEARCLEAAKLRETENLTFKELGMRLGVSTSRAHSLCSKAERIKRRPQARQELSVRTYNCIAFYRQWPEGEATITPEVVAALGQDALLKTPNFGPKCLTEVMQWLNSKGLALAP